LLLFLESRLFGSCMELSLDVGEACWGLVGGHCCGSSGELQEGYGGRRYDMASGAEQSAEVGVGNVVFVALGWEEERVEKMADLRRTIN